MKEISQSGYIAPIKKIKFLSKQALKETTQKQYEKAMQYMARVNTLEAQRKVYQEQLDPECSFHPHSYTKGYKGPCRDPKDDRKLEYRLIDWGKKRDVKINKKAIDNSVEVQAQIVNNLNCSVEKPQIPTYLKKNINSRQSQSKSALKFQNSQLKSPLTTARQRLISKKWLSSNTTTTKSFLMI